MSFLAPNLPDLDITEWRKRPHLERIRPLAQHWVENGFGTPSAVYLLYLIKIALYIVGGAWIIAITTPGLGGLTNIGSWWSEPIVFEKAVVLTLLYEVLGLGCASGPLTFRFLPPIGGALYWLRPGTTRLAPWPDKVPFTKGYRRTIVDVLLYAAVIASAVGIVVASPTSAGLVPTSALIPLAVLLPVLGLRDKTIFLAARAEQYWVTLLLFFFPLTQMIAGVKLVMVALWWGAATSKLNRHFPFVVAIMMSNSPLLRSKRVKRAMYRDYPNDLIPSKLASVAAHTGTVIEYVVPLVLLLSRGGPVTVVALVVIVVFHLHILSTIPMGVPLEWNVFFMYSALFLFGHNANVSPLAIHSPLLIALLLSTVVAMPVIGNLRPDWVSFLPAMRYYAGNWATSLWCFRKGSEAKLDANITKTAPIVSKQLTRLYGPDLAELMQQKAMAWRSMHTHGRALNGLLPRALDDVEEYDVREGEFTGGVILGWNFGDGHLHNEQLLEAVQDQCHFTRGELRVVMLESQPIQGRFQHYRIVDAATGTLEDGDIAVDDMVIRQPWLDATRTIPVTNVKTHATRRQPSVKASVS